MVISDPIVPAPEFDFEAGALCLDFCNTANWHASPHPEEDLTSYAHLLSWAFAAGLLTSSQAAGLLRLSEQRPTDARACLRQAIALREAIYDLFSAQAAGRAFAQADLDLLNQALRQAMPHLRLDPAPEGLAWGWEDQPHALERMLWPIARSAAELLTSEMARRVGECEDDRGCGYLFLDTSRNRSRRWCSMESCGNRAKAQRHYHRPRTRA